MSRREGSLGKGLKGRMPSARGEQGQKGWKLGSGSPPPLSRGRERPERGRTGQRCQDPQADSSASPLPHLEAKIQQTHSLARLLTKYAEQLLQEYVQHQGDPFGLPGFSPPRLPVADLSDPAPGHAGLPVPERLRLDAAALAALPPLLDVVRRLQGELNPLALRLLGRLEDAARQVRALGAAVEAVLAALGAESRGPRPEPAAAAVAAATASAGVFPAKVLGFRVCGLYLEWVSRTEADLGQLAPGGPA
uniref:Cardiotrophin 1 n=1 Tax=Ovis aries TaxID=9940 RepID=A0AC11CHS6_SHEEP